MKERTPDPYSGLLKGEYRRLSDIQEKVPHVAPALQTLINDGRVQGQFFFDEFGKTDTLLWYLPGVERKAREREKSQHRPKCKGGDNMNEKQPIFHQDRQLPLEGIGGAEQPTFADLPLQVEMKPRVDYSLPANLLAPWPPRKVRRVRIIESRGKNIQP